MAGLKRGQASSKKADGLAEALRIIGVAQRMCLEGMSKLERRLGHLGSELRERLSVLEDTVASRRGCELTPLLRGRVPKPRARLKRKEDPS